MKRQTIAIRLCLLLAALALICGREVRAELAAIKQPPALAQAAEYAHRHFETSHQRWLSQTNDASAACDFGRACYDWAEFADKAPQRAEIALQGIDACRSAARLQPQLGAAHYYLAMNFGQLAQARSVWTALKLVRDMEVEFKAALELDAHLDFAGAYRCLGELYRDAPGPPLSIGNRTKAKDYLVKAVAACPEFPANQIALMEVWLKLGDRQSVKAHFEEVERILQDARPRLSGVEWTMIWRDWEERLDRIKHRSGVLTAKH